MHNHDHLIGLIGIAILFTVPIVTGYLNDRKRDKEREERDR